MLTNHCGKHQCICTHTDPCEYGWIWVEYYDEVKVKLPDGSYSVKAEAREGVVFCPTCSPERAHIQKVSKSSDEMYDRLRAMSKHSRTKAYEENESSKTRTL